MATPVIFHEFYNHLATGVHDLSTASLKVVLSDSAPSAANNTVLANITQISATGGYSSGGYDLDSESWAETGSGSGVWRLTFADEVITATGGDIGPFRYVVIYNDTPTSPADPLIGYLDYGSSITVTEGNTLTLDLGSDGFLQMGTGTLA